jgi:hypothetical protein
VALIGIGWHFFGANNADYAANDASNNSVSDPASPNGTTEQADPASNLGNEPAPDGSESNNETETPNALPAPSPSAETPDGSPTTPGSPGQPGTIPNPPVSLPNLVVEEVPAERTELELTLEQFIAEAEPGSYGGWDEGHDFFFESQESAGPLRVDYAQGTIGFNEVTRDWATYVRCETSSPFEGIDQVCNVGRAYGHRATGWDQFSETPEWVEIIWLLVDNDDGTWTRL